MKLSQSFWRVLFFVLMIAALCSGLALPAGNIPARAAPQMQATMQVVINEVAWGGTAASSSDEWIELYNPSATDIVDLSGWRIITVDGSPNPIVIPVGKGIPPNGYFLLERSENAVSDILADYAYGGNNLANNGEALELRDASNNLIDTANIDTGAWPAGSASPNHFSMERINSLLADSDSNWATNNGLVRNGLDSATPTPNPINGTPKQPNSVTLALTATVTPTNTGVPTDTGTPTSTGTATNTGTPTPTGSATSTGTPTPTVSATSTGTPTFTPTATSPSTGSASGVVISEFRTSAGSGAATNEYVEIYNPTSNWIDISGWKISGSNSNGDTQIRATIPASTILRAGQYYLIAHTGYVPIGGVSANLTYGTGISDDGGIALLGLFDVIIDEVGMHENSFYQEGQILAPLSDPNRSYERKAGEPAGSCVDTDNNASDFSRNPPSPHNYSTIRFCDGTTGPTPSTTTTTITSSTPDPSVVNGNVTVSVSVTGGSTTPSGKVNITGANTNCTITLFNGTGSCTVKFTSTGSKTITATYLGDNTHFSSIDTEPHQVTTTTGATSTVRTATPASTRQPTPLPPPPLIGINEFVPRPGHDWNNDGVINTNDEYIELINHGVIDVNLSGYSLDDEVNIGSSPYTLPSITLRPGQRRVFYGSETGLLLSDGGDGVRLLKPNGQLGDAYNYSVVRFPDQSYCRLPDNGGLDDWNQNCFPTPGLQNSLSTSSVNPPISGDGENLCPVSDTLPADFVLAECLPFGNNIFNPVYWDQFGWFNERYLPESTGKWPVFVD